jgi:transcriptional regulator with XRE-family HTH domain
VAIRSGVAFTTLSRILKGQQKSSVSPHVTLELVAFLKKEYRIPLLLAKLPAPIERYLSSNFGKFLFH